MLVSATCLTTYLTSVTFTEIIKKLFYNMHDSSTDMYTWNVCFMTLFIVSIITQLKCFSLRSNFYGLQKFYADSLSKIMKEKPILPGSMKIGSLVFLTKKFSSLKLTN